MKKNISHLLLFFVLLNFQCAYAIVFINDSPDDVKVETFNVADNSYIIAASSFLVSANSMVNHVADDNGKCKIRIWRVRDNIVIFGPGPVYTDNDIIRVDQNGGVYVTNLVGAPHSSPNPFSESGVIHDGEGFVIDGASHSINSLRNDYSLQVSSIGGLTLIQNKGAKVLWGTGGDTQIKYVVFSQGKLWFLTQLFEVIKSFSGFAGNAYLGIDEGALKILKPGGFLVWAAPSPAGAKAFFPTPCRDDDPCAPDACDPSSCNNNPDPCKSGKIFCECTGGCATRAQCNACIHKSEKNATGILKEKKTTLPEK